MLEQEDLSAAVGAHGLDAHLLGIGSRDAEARRRARLADRDQELAVPGVDALQLRSVDRITAKVGDVTRMVVAVTMTMAMAMAMATTELAPGRDRDPAAEQ